MRRSLAFVAAALLLTASAALAQGPKCVGAVSDAHAILRDSSRTRPANEPGLAVSQSFLTVALIYDSTCTIVQRAVGRRQGRPTVDSLLALLIPSASTRSYWSGGIAHLRPLTSQEAERYRPGQDGARDGGEPWVVWRVQRIARQ